MSENVLLMGFTHRRHFSKYKVAGLQYNLLPPPQKKLYRWFANLLDKQKSFYSFRFPTQIGVNIYKLKKTKLPGILI